MKRDEEVMVDIVEALANGTQSLQGAALSCGVATRTFWRWMQQSKEGDEKFLIGWPDPDQPVQFYRAVSMARKMLALSARSEFERKNLFGYERIVHFQGAPVPMPDARAVGLSREIRELLGYDPDGYLRDENGAVVWVTEHVEPPVQATIKYLSSMFPEYRERLDQTVNINGGLTLGVSTVSRRTREQGPPEIPDAPIPPRVVRVIEARPSVEPVIEETADEPEDDVTSTLPIKDEPEAISEPTPVPEPERVIRTETPQQWQPTANEKAGKPLSNLEVELLSRLRNPNPAMRSASPIGSTVNTLIKTPRPA